MRGGGEESVSEGRRGCEEGRRWCECEGGDGRRGGECECEGGDVRRGGGGVSVKERM